MQISKQKIKKEQDIAVYEYIYIFIFIIREYLI